METKNFVPSGAIVVRLNENLIGENIELHLRTKGSIVRTVKESYSGEACYREYAKMYIGDWRYATAFEMYCFMNIHIQINNINQITEYHKELFNKYLSKKDGNNKNKRICN